ncbi:MAG: enolase C-terminal domain-like protein [Phycisphaeraceae bacterium]
MKITAMHVTPIAITDPPLLNAAGLHAPYALRTVVELVTDDGVSGVAEVPGSDGTRAALGAARDVVLGRDPFHLRPLLMELERKLDAEADGRWGRGNRVQAQSAVDVACYDIMGKAVGRPVVDLLGGPVRERVPFSAYLFYKHEGAGGALGFDTDPAASGWSDARQQQALTPDELVAQARAMVDAFGFKSLKLKGGVFEPAIEVATIHALRDAFGPDVPLRIDPNAIWQVDTAITWGRKMQGVLEYYEDPVRGQASMAAVREAIDIPMATNMCTTSFAHIPESIRVGSEDIILADHHAWGGLTASMELGRLCMTFGRKLSMHSNSHLGISLAAMTHLAAALPALSYAADTHYPWQSDEVITRGRFEFEDGELAVPTAPGLGVELDREALARLHENYLACGLTRRNDEAEMQKVQPGWRFEPTRW